MIVFIKLVCVLCLVWRSVYAFYTEDVPMAKPRLSYTGNENEVEVDYQYYTREMWGARKPKDTNKLKTPVPFVVIHHTYIPGACYTEESCKNAMKAMQNFHMDDRGWFDIGYNFCVGSDGGVYEGRGWKTLGAHALHFNTVSLGICLIGNWSDTSPPEKQLQITQELIKVGVNIGIIKEEYKMVGHRQVRETECPGEVLFREIQSWPHYSVFPRNVNDLLDVEELPESTKAFIRNNTKVSSTTASTNRKE